MAGHWATTTREALGTKSAQTRTPGSDSVFGRGAVAPLGARGVTAARARPLAERRLGPVVGLGTWNTFDADSDAALARRLVGAAVEAGMRMVDTSPMYEGAEASLAAALAGRRDEIDVATKIWAHSTEGQGAVRPSARLVRRRRDRADPQPRGVAGAAPVAPRRAGARTDRPPRCHALRLVGAWRVRRFGQGTSRRFRCRSTLVSATASECSSRSPRSWASP